MSVTTIKASKKSTSPVGEREESLNREQQNGKIVAKTLLMAETMRKFPKPTK